MKYLLTCFLLFISLFSFGQKQEKIDSLKSRLTTTKDNNLKASIMLSLSKITENTNLIYSEEMAMKAIELGSLENNLNVLSESYFQLAYLNYKQQKDNKAITYFNKLDSVLKPNNIMNEAFIKSKLYRAQIAKFTFSLEGLKRSKEYLNEMLLLSKSIDNLKYEYLSYYQLGDWYNTFAEVEDEKENIDTARVYFDKALKYFTKTNDNENLARIYQDLSSLEFQLKEYDKAESYLLKKLNLMKAEKDSINIAKSYYLIGRFYRKTNKPKKAISYLNQAKNIFSTTGFPNNDYRQKYYTNSAMAYNGIGDFENAYKYLRKSYLLKDTIERNRSRSITIEMEAKYQNKEKQQEITLLESQNELVEQQKTNQLNQLLSGIGFTSLAGLFFFFLYRNRQKTTKKLQELDKAKSNFFANISHEFRTPLTLISGPIQKQLQKESLPDDERDNFEMMHRNSTRILSLVDQLLDISKIEAGSLKLKIAKKELMSFIGSLADGFTYVTKQKELNYIINNNPTANDTWFDKDVLEKIVTNLLSNAIKYTPAKGSIVCDAFVKENQFYFEVKNTGLGLSKEEQDKVFERFYQLNENKQGVGIGLALVKELVNLHKGIITVESIPNEWTTFKVALPIYKEAFKEMEIFDGVAIKSTNEEMINPKASGVISEVNTVTDTSKDTNGQQDSDNPILLMVDDNDDIRTYVSTIFKDTYTILTAKNGQEGIDLAIEHIPDIIISDIMMPVKDGIELCNILKVDERTSHIPVILLTAKAGEENEIEGIKTGADDYVTKPFNEELLKLRVQKLIEGRKKLQERYSQEVILRPKDIAITSVDEQFLQRLQKVLDDKLVESSFSIEDFSQAVGMSRMQLHRKLKALTGLSATEFIRSQRLKLAAQLLKKSEINVSQVGYSVGFNDHAYFSKCFKEMYHCTPTEYANNSK